MGKDWPDVRKGVKKCQEEPTWVQVELSNFLSLSLHINLPLTTGLTIVTNKKY